MQLQPISLILFPNPPTPRSLCMCVCLSVCLYMCVERRLKGTGTDVDCIIQVIHQMTECRTMIYLTRACIILSAYIYIYIYIYIYVCVCVCVWSVYVCLYVCVFGLCVYAYVIACACSCGVCLGLTSISSVDDQSIYLQPAHPHPHPVSSLNVYLSVEKIVFFFFFFNQHNFIQ